MNLEYDDRDSRYHGQWSDGRTFSVDSDVFAECLADARQELMAKGMSYEDAYDRVDHSLSESSAWSEDMDGVEIEIE